MILVPLQSPSKGLSNGTKNRLVLTQYKLSRLVRLGEAFVLEFNLRSLVICLARDIIDFHLEGSSHNITLSLGMLRCARKVARTEISLFSGFCCHDKKVLSH